MEHAPVNASSCEAKLHGFRKTQDGIVVSFFLHPQEAPQQLALDPLGTRYMLAFAAVGDDEQPLPPTQRASPDRAQAGKDRYAASDERERALTRAALLPKDPRFREWIASLASHSGTAEELSEERVAATRDETTS